jgi:hypothetical protein
MFDAWSYIVGGTPIALALTTPLVFDRPRRSRIFAAVSAVLAAASMVWWWTCLRRSYALSDQELFMLSWTGLLFVRASWQLTTRPRALYVPPPDPPPLGGPYR